MIDTHCHLDMEPFDTDRSEVLKRSREAGVEAVISIGSDLKSSRSAFDLACRYSDVYAAIGLHPHDAKDFNPRTLSGLEVMLEEDRSGKHHATGSATARGNGNRRIVAIGETGLDYHYDHSPRGVQRDVFLKMLLFARSQDMPVVVHSRESGDTLPIIRESGVRKGVMHCFSGGPAEAEETMELGFHISIAGPVTFPRADSLRNVVRVIPDDRILIETDAPYLSPQPLRGRRNEPANIAFIARTIAEIRGVTPEDIGRITTVNAKRLFGIGGLPDGEVAYKIRDNLYLNITNRCTNACTFCVRFHTDFVKGHNLRLDHEPTEEELKKAIGDPAIYHEIVFCGYGEPLLRLDLVKSLASWIKGEGGKVRINTNGHGNLIHGRNIVPELAGIVDSVSVSLNADTGEKYRDLCKPLFDEAFGHVLEFMKEARLCIPEVQATVVNTEGVDIGRCREIAENIGVRFRERKIDIVG